jgi:hypothetical protein
VALANGRQKRIESLTLGDKASAVKSVIYIFFLKEKQASACRRAGYWDQVASAAGQLGLS